ncbi:permease [Achromobacter pulmonis]|uniref:Permease n=1 Tax=Achromobacter pulmonis TaxID=1389932 RepID=A0A2N8KK58_9BURK|nr:permease [Achromobacter pulmonis]PND33837.1 permease [Achromobacter pulmonis]
MSLFLPVLYLILGWGVGRYRPGIRRQASTLLTRYTIPFVITYNVATKFSEMYVVIIGTVVAMMVMMRVSRWFSPDPLRNLCFFYLNIGWLGLPIASTLFGDGATTILIAAYVGSSVMGNSLGFMLLSPHTGGSNALLAKKLLISPPVLSVALGIVLMPLHSTISHYLSPVHEAAKFTMSFLGMAILGIWLSQTRMNLSDFKHELLEALWRAISWAAIGLVIIYLAWTFHAEAIYNNKATVFLLCFLPPAANIIVLETYYVGTGRSARIISCSTCISILAIACYGAVTTLMHVTQ